MMIALGVLLAALAFLSPLSSAQCLNTVAAYNPDVRSMSVNATWFVVPVPKDAVLKAVKASYPLQNLALLDVPTSDTSLFPNGFPSGMHPVMTSIGLSNDIRMSVLQIDGGLMSNNLIVPYVSKGGSEAPIAASTAGYIAGENGPLPNGLVPAIASSLLFGGNELRLGEFIPEGMPYQSDGTTLSASSKWALVPNPLSGPGVYPNVNDLSFMTTQSSKYTAKTFRSLVNQPLLLPSGLCQRNQYYFNNATALPAFRTGQVTFGPGADGHNPISGRLQNASPDGSGVYSDVDGYSACAQNVGNNPESCDDATANVDPAAVNMGQ